MRKHAVILVLLIAGHLYPASGQPFSIRSAANELHIFKEGIEHPLIVQNADVGMRPFLHPVYSANGVGLMTQLSPDHHPHQTGIYWGLKKTNGRDFFKKFGKDHFRKVSSSIEMPSGE